MKRALAGKRGSAVVGRRAALAIGAVSTGALVILPPNGGIPLRPALLDEQSLGWLVVAVWLLAVVLVLLSWVFAALARVIRRARRRRPRGGNERSALLVRREPLPVRSL